MAGELDEQSDRPGDHAGGSTSSQAGTSNGEIFATGDRVIPNTARLDDLGQDFGYIVVEGPIGVGKTSLCSRLSESLGFSRLLERPGENPFLERFYADPTRFSLATQLHFLFQLSDFLVDKDPLFAKMNLDPDEYELYMQVYQRVAVQAPTPDLVIYLQAPAKVLEDRISRRGVPFEQVMSRDYLERVNDMYVNHFMHYTGAPLLTINAESINFVDNEEDYASLLHHASKIRSGRHYFNPLPSGPASG